PINTSTCRNFETISSGFGRLFAILGPPFPKHRGGPVQLGRLRTKSENTFPRKEVIGIVQEKTGVSHKQALNAVDKAWLYVVRGRSNGTK
ncbi:hypothetical protein, partial [Thalassobius sp. Cn5-15]|uniref:hypothetical protein n=1 Tax=Thalassobius sp. Cn5-15 TaxID=2917763 RepID=UPI001EF3D511